MILEIYKYKYNNYSKKIVKKYSTIETHSIEKIELLIYSPYFQLYYSKGRPRTIWHESYANDILNSGISFRLDEKEKIAYLTKTYSFFTNNFIEEKEFNKIWENRNNFLSWRYGDSK